MGFLPVILMSVYRCTVHLPRFDWSILTIKNGVD
jgi:hypothetical protein